MRQVSSADRWLAVLAALCAASVLAACGGAEDRGGPSTAGVGAAGTNGGSGGTGSGTGGTGSGTGGTGSGTGGTGSGTGGGGAGGTGVPVSSFDAGTAPDRNDVMPGEICDRLATIQCAGEAACCSNPGRSFDDCLGTLAASCRDNFHFDEIAADGKTGFNPAGAAAAFTELERRASMCDPQVAQWAVSGAGFLSAFDGTVPENGSCTPPGGGSFTDIFSMGSPEQIAALASCQNNEAVVCLPSLTVWTCLARSGEGGGCVFDGNCLDGLYCADTSRILQDQCQARKPVGSECATANECATFICIDGTCAEATQDNAYCLERLQ